MTHQLGAVGESVGYVDRRRGYRFDDETRVVTGPTVFTANASGSTTTIVGANATYPAGTNVVRVGDKFKLFNSSGVLKEEKVFTISAGGIAVAASTTVTFSPAAAVATASGDVMKLLGTTTTDSNAEKDARLVALGFSAARVATMTENDKIMQLRASDDAGSL